MVIAPRYQPRCEMIRRKSGPTTLAKTPRAIDLHRFDIEAGRHQAKQADKNSPILCCQCGAEFYRGTWADTVAAYRVHEPICSC